MRSLFNAWSTPSLAKIFELIRTASSPKTIRPCDKKTDYNPSGGFSLSPGGHPGGKASSGFLLDRGKEKETLVFLNRVKPLKSPRHATSGPVNLVFSLVKLDFFTPCKQSLPFFSSWSRRRSRRSPNFWTSQSRFPSSNWFFECEPQFIDKPIVITEPAIPSARLLGLGSKLYPGNIQRMLN